MAEKATFYWWASCQQCRVSRQALQERTAAFEERDFFKHKLSAEEVTGLLHGRTLREVFSEKSPSVKKLGLTPATMTDAEMLEWILKEPRLLKRPLLVVGGKLLVQPKPADLDAAFS